MRLSEMLARSARSKRRPRRSLAVPKAKRLSTPIVLITKDKVKTKRSKRVEKVRAWEKEAVRDWRLANSQQLKTRG